jgi:hypothetical protein
MPEEEISPPQMREIPEFLARNPPLPHRDGSVEHEYIVNVSADLPSIRLRIFIFPNGDASTEAEFTQEHTAQS